MQSQTTDILNDILEGERSAVETYQQVLEKVGEDPRASELRRLHDDHREAIVKLQDHVRQRIDQPATDSGAWGTFAKVVTGTAKLFGDQTALKALKEGEEHGLKQYSKALNSDIDASVKTLIRTQFIPAQENHIASLDTLLSRVAS